MNDARTTTAPEDFHWTWTLGGAVVTVAVLGALIGRVTSPLPPPPAPTTGFALEAGRLVARGDMQSALNRQAAGASAAGPVALQLSFVDTRGTYCRTFATVANAGLACREGPDWVVHLLVDGPEGDARAASNLPRAVLIEVDRRIVGAALDAKEETQAIQQGWER